MGFLFAVLYLVTAYIGPATIFGSLAAYHIGVIFAVILLLIAPFSLQGSLVWKTPQSLALIGLAFATFMSLLMTGWAGGAVKVLLDFIPNAFAYFLICLYCNSLKKLRIIVFMLLAVCLFVTARGYYDLQHPVIQMVDDEEVPIESPYLLPQRSDSGDWFFRIRGQDFINDPNDFAQLLACVTPLLFIFWRPKKLFRNFVIVILPSCILLFGAYLTHSRGGMLAILALTIVALRRRIGTLLAAGLGVGLFLGATALNFTGGRQVSADSGADRMDLWGQGIQLFRSHPLFGVGFSKMPDYTGLTAHNSVVVCAAELGLLGLFFWSLFLFPTLRDAQVIASSKKVSKGNPPPAPVAPTPFAISKVETLDKAEINRLGSLLVVSLTGFLVSGWFLSRAYTMTLFLLGGIVEVVFEMARERGMIPSRVPFLRVVQYAAVFTVSLLVITYIVIRIGNLLRFS
jgi:O-antigen ligase